MKKLFLFFIVLVSCRSYAQFKLDDFKPLYRLASSWEAKLKNGVLVEQWERVNDSVMHSQSYRVNGKDTIPEETVELQFANGRISFTPAVSNQNEGMPVSFTLISIQGSKYTFENKSHDFPQQIIYNLSKKNLHVTINGHTKDGFREIPFNFGKK